MKILIPTCDQYINHIEALQYSVKGAFLDKFEYIIIGYEAPNFELNKNWSFVSMGEQKGAKYWGNDMIRFLSTFPDSHFIYGNDDCAVTHMDKDRINIALWLSNKYKSIGRYALMAEGKKRNILPFFKYGSPNIDPNMAISQFHHDSDYLLSLGWSIYNKECFLEFCKEYQSPWDFELSSCDGNNREGLIKWNFLTFNPTEGAIDAAFFRRKNIQGVIPDWHKGYYGHDLDGDKKEAVRQILFKT